LGPYQLPGWVYDYSIVLAGLISQQTHNGVKVIACQVSKALCTLIRGHFRNERIDRRSGFGEDVGGGGLVGIGRR